MSERLLYMCVGGGLVAFLLLTIAYCALKVINHEKSQQIRLTNLEAKLSMLQDKNDENTVKWNSNNYNYLAIGNSITKHEINGYWWNECGMAASTEDKDYVHLVSNSLNANYYAYNFAVWEMISHDRGETLSVLDKMLSDELDLVTIQLSENILDMSTFETDFEDLIRYIQERCPQAKIVALGDFWDAKKDEIKIRACEKTNIVFAGLDEIRGLSEFECGVGTSVYDNSGNPHLVEHKGVAKHPNDKGMKQIANAILLAVKNN